MDIDVVLGSQITNLPHELVINPDTVRATNVLEMAARIKGQLQPGQRINRLRIFDYREQKGQALTLSYSAQLVSLRELFDPAGSVELFFTPFQFRRSDYSSKAGWKPAKPGRIRRRRIPGWVRRI